ncbi:hypothetical protein ACU6QR_00655, partial [Aeromonas veronii]|uniref:hypothetical protein n=1 Tax=Aeromonas veronii TaxID=654 RepID=UPI00406C3FBA
MRRRLTPWLLPAAILVAWELASRSGLLSARILPEPAAVAAAPGPPDHIGMSLHRLHQRLPHGRRLGPLPAHYRALILQSTPN